MNKKKNIVIFGGANGTSLIVRSLKPFVDEYNINAVVSMSDSGRSSAKMRDEVGYLPTADLIRVIYSFSSYDYNLLKELLYKNRFTTHEKLNNFNIGALFLGLAGKYTDDLVATIRAMEEVLKCVGKVFPATLDMTDLNVELESGRTIKGEGEIDDPEGLRDSTIKRAWLERDGKLFDGAKEVIENADIIVTGPGDLYTSSIASLLAKGTKEAIELSGAPIIYVAGNKYTANGEFAPIKLSERISALENYLPKKVNNIIYNSHIPAGEEKGLYNKKHWGILENDMEEERVNVSDFERKGGGISTKKLGKILKDIII